MMWSSNFVPLNTRGISMQATNISPVISKPRLKRRRPWASPKLKPCFDMIVSNAQDHPSGWRYNDQHQYSLWKPGRGVWVSEVRYRHCTRNYTFIMDPQKVKSPYRNGCWSRLTSTGRVAFLVSMVSAMAVPGSENSENSYLPRFVRV